MLTPRERALDAYKAATWLPTRPPFGADRAGVTVESVRARRREGFAAAARAIRAARGTRRALVHEPSDELLDAMLERCRRES